MIRISEKIEIAAPPSEIWSILHDPAAVASCIPGAALSDEIAPGLYEATMSIKFGPTVAHFTGEARVEYDEASRRCTVSGRGNDKRGSSPASGSGIISLSGGTKASLTVDGSFDVAGPLEAFVETGGVFVARALLAQFAENVGKLVQSRTQPPAGAPDAGAAPAPTLAPAAPLSSGKLLRDVCVHWLRAVVNWLLRRK